MAIVLEANYAKKLGLPGYSSHQYSVSIRTELTDLSQVEEESAKLYRLLQDSVDGSIQEVGFMPDPNTYGATHASGVKPTAVNGNGARHSNAAASKAWSCSDKQRELIEKIVSENNIDKTEVEHMSQEFFSCGVRQLNRLQASGLIDELLERFCGGNRKGGKPASRNNGWSRTDLANCAAQVHTVSKPVFGGRRS